MSALGCKSFAILFDDIDCDMCAADAKEFPSFAHAQVTITNDIYTDLEHPDVFLFCPTEYCGSRATPNVTESQYLKHIGSDLHPNIDVMWTGKYAVYVCVRGRGRVEREWMCVCVSVCVQMGSPWDFPDNLACTTVFVVNNSCCQR